MPTLTKSAIDRAKYTGNGQSRCAIWDDGKGAVPGFGVRIYPPDKNGVARKSFIFSYRAGGRKRMMVIGAFGAITLEQARTAARRHHVAVQDGKDPLDEKKRQNAQGKTFGDLIDQYIDDYAVGPRGRANPKKKTWKKDKRRLEIHALPIWKGKRPRDISPQDVTDLFNKLVAEKPYEANRLHETLRKMFDLARGWKYLALDAINPAKEDVATGLMERFEEEKRKVWLRPAQMKALAGGIDGEESIYVRSVFMLFMLTGLRHMELLKARREQVLWDIKVLRLPDTKSGEEQSATLSDPAIAILQTLPVQSGNPYLFPGQKKGRPLHNINKAWGRIKDRATVLLWEAYEHDERVPALVERLKQDSGRYPTTKECREASNFELPPGIENLRIHDLRRTTGSWMSSMGTDLNMIKSALRHKEIATTLTYARLADDAARPAMEEHGKNVMRLAGKVGPVGVPAESD
jgi:integrase